MIGHRGAGIKALMGASGPQDAFRISSRSSTSSATGLMEAGARNGVKNKASLVNGAFSQLRRDRTCGFEAERMEVPWGQVFDPQAVRDRLKKGGIDAITVVHSETSTGALNPVGEIAKVVHEFDDVVILVDSVTGIGGAPALTDEWKLDWILTGSQKALALPPGLSFGTPSERMMERSKAAKNKGVYFDLVTFAKNQKDFMTPTTPALSVMYSWTAAQAHQGRDDGGPLGPPRGHARALRRVGGFDARGPRRGDRGARPEGSPLAHRHHEEDAGGPATPPAVAAMKEKGFVIGGGCGRSGLTFRIGHMGDHTVAGQEAVLRR